MLVLRSIVILFPKVNSVWNVSQRPAVVPFDRAAGVTDPIRDRGRSTRSGVMLALPTT